MDRPDESATLRDWMTRFGPALRGFFRRRVRAEADTEDLVQDVFLRVIQRTASTPIEHPQQYLFQTAANVLRDYLRKGVVRQAGTHESLPDDIEDTDFSPERVLLGKDRLQNLLTIIEELDARTRAIFMLCHFDGMKQADIAKRVGVSLSTVEKALARANKALLEQRTRVGGS